MLRRLLAGFAIVLMLVGVAAAGPSEDGYAAYVRGDYAEAAKLYRLAAKQGDAYAQYALGVMYARGEGVPQDYVEAVKLYRLAAKQGFAAAQHNLGSLYARGQGVPQDYVEAAKWHRLAVDQGVPDAKGILAIMFGETERAAAPLSEPPVAALASSGRFALIVANLAYKGAELVNPETDARLVQSALLKLGFDVTLAIDADLARFDASLRQFESRAEGAEIALFYFAGHGFALNNSLGASNYLMAVDADVTSTSDVLIRAGGLPLDEIVGSLADRAETTLVFVDACRNDPRLTRGSGRGRGLAPVSSVGSGSLFVGISTKLGELAEDGEDGEGSPFARAFAENIGEPGTRIDDAFNSIRLTVKQATNGLQQPEVVRYELNAPLILNDKAAEAEADEKARLEAEALAQRAEEERARQAAEAARLEAEAAAKAEADARAEAGAEQARRLADEKARQDAEAIRAADEAARAAEAERALSEAQNAAAGTPPAEAAQRLKTDVGQAAPAKPKPKPDGFWEMVNGE